MDSSIAPDLSTLGNHLIYESLAAANLDIRAQTESLWVFGCRYLGMLKRILLQRSIQTFHMAPFLTPGDQSICRTCS